MAGLPMHAILHKVGNGDPVAVYPTRVSVHFHRRQDDSPGDTMLVMGNREVAVQEDFATTMKLLTAALKGEEPTPQIGLET